MREWRKVYKSVTASEKAGLVSDSALLLYFLTLPHQDDAGRIPWNRPFARAMTATREWSWPQVEEFARELTSAGLVETEGCFLTIVRGRELNGRPHDAKKELLYPSPVVVTTVVPWSEPLESGGKEERRVEENPPVVPPSGDAKPEESLTPLDAKKPKGNGTRSRSKLEAVKLEVSSEFTQSMLARYADVLGPERVNDEIERALTHKAAQNYALNVEPYVKGWLGREARTATERNGHGKSIPVEVYAGARELTLDDFPEPEPPKANRQAYSAWADQRERWWQLNNPNRKQRSRSG